MIQCDHCSSTFSERKSLLRHERSKHQNIKFNCAHCEYSCNRKDNLTRHIQIQHEGKLKRKIEPEPEKTKRKRYYEDNDIFNSDDEMEVDEDQILNEAYDFNLNAEKSNHDENARHSCKQCDNTFTIKSNLYRHIRNHHEQNHLCEKCGKSFAKLESFSNHKCHVNEKVKARDNLDIDENVVGSSDETEEGNTSSAFNGLFNSQTWRIRNSTDPLTLIAKYHPHIMRYMIRLLTDHGPAKVNIVMEITMNKLGQKKKVRKTAFFHSGTRTMLRSSQLPEMIQESATKIGLSFDAFVQNGSEKESEENSVFS